MTDHAYPGLSQAYGPVLYYGYGPDICPGCGEEMGAHVVGIRITRGWVDTSDAFPIPKAIAPSGGSVGSSSRADDIDRTWANVLIRCESGCKLILSIGDHKGSLIIQWASPNDEDVEWVSSDEDPA